MTSKEQLDKLVEIANTPIDDNAAYDIAAQHINAMIMSARKVFGGLSTEAQFAQFTAQASRNLKGSEICLLVHFLDRFLLAQPLVDGGRTALRWKASSSSASCGRNSGLRRRSWSSTTPACSLPGPRSARLSLPHG